MTSLVKTLATDPGGTNGIAIFTPKANEPLLGSIVTTQLRGPELDLWWLIGLERPQHLVYEQYNFRQGALGNDFTPVERIGVIKLYAQLNYVPCDSMNSGEAMAFWTDSKIKALGLWIPGSKFNPPTPGKNHAMDALRVLFTFLMKNDEFKKNMLLQLKDKL